MKSLPQAVRDSLIPGLVAGASVAATASLRGRRDTGSAVAPVNATSHVLWGERAAEVERVTLRHTLPGLLINLGAGAFWATVYEKLFGAAVDRRGLPAALLAGALTAGLAYVTDYRLMPARLTPGWEKRLSDRSLFLTLGVLGVGLGAGAMLARRWRR